MQKLSKSCSCGNDCSCGNKGGNYCNGNYGEPKGHLDTQIFPCKKDPQHKKKKKKKAGTFNLMQYKQAMQDIQSNPDIMNQLDPSDLDLFTELKAKHPNLSLKEIIDIIRKKKLFPKDEPEFPSQRDTLPNTL